MTTLPHLAQAQCRYDVATVATMSLRKPWGGMVKDFKKREIINELETAEWKKTVLNRVYGNHDVSSNKCKIDYPAITETVTLFWPEVDFDMILSFIRKMTELGAIHKINGEYEAVQDDLMEFYLEGVL